MDPLSALAIAAAVIQFLDIGGKLLHKGWTRCQQMQQEIPDDGELEKQEEELKETLEELSLQISGFQQVSTNMMAPEPATPAQAQLLQLLLRCNSLSEELEKIKNQIKPPNSLTVNTEIHLRSHVSSVPSRKPSRNVLEEYCKECQKRRKEEKAEFERIVQEIERITRQLEALRPNVIESVILSLWDDSKRSQHWEVQFNDKLNKAIELLEKAQGSTTNTKTPTIGNGFGDKMPRQYSSQVDEEVITLRKAIEPLIQPENGPLSLKRLAEDIVRSLRSESGARASIQDELVNILWKLDWKLDISMADYTSANIDSRVVSSAIAAGVEFDTIQLRENAIPKSFETTYSWIFQDEPPVDQDIPRWHSFPKWLQDDSHEVYWITGKPGSGKSTIMKLILQHESLRDALSQSLGSLHPLLVKYYAWHPGSTLQKSLEGLKRTAIHRALKQRPELAPSLTPRRWAFSQVLRSTSGLPAWGSWEIEESFEALLSLCGKTIKLILFIDGLDEFDTPPIEVVNCIRHIKARCHSGIKVCAASRPWTEFQDEFNDGPMLQMHLQTQEDMRDFITKSFAGNRGFLEQQQLRPAATSQLLADILHRANGVFLWVSLVTKHLLNLFSEGESISQAGKTLERLPTDLSSLYDIIWAGIRPQHLADAAYMMRVLQAADGPLGWFTMWLIEELRFAPVDIDALPMTLTWRRVAMQSLKRKLAARTKCILEVYEDPYNGRVDFIHRTARDWAVQPDRWQLICSLMAGDFDPHLSILQAHTLIPSDSNYVIQTDGSIVQDLIARASWHAGEVKDTPMNRERLLHHLKLLDDHVRRLHVFRTSKTIISANHVAIERYGWYATGSSKPWSIDKNLLGLAAQFAVLPYVETLALDRRSFVFHVEAPGLLEKAIFGCSYFQHQHLPDHLCSLVPSERRLATVRYLLKQGVYQSRVRSRGGTCSLKEAIRRVSSKDPEYYTAVIGLLDQMGLKASAKSKGLRIKYFLEDMGHTSLSTVKLITDKKSL